MQDDTVSVPENDTNLAALIANNPHLKVEDENSRKCYYRVTENSKRRSIRFPKRDSPDRRFA